MKLSDVFFSLASGELSQLNLVDSVTGDIHVDKYRQLIAHVNLGLTDLYTRFPLKEGRVNVTLESDRITYPITTREDVGLFPETGAEDFGDDILKIEQVLTSAGKAFSLNDPADPYSCYTPSMTTLRVSPAVVAKSAEIPADLITDSLIVVYRANHPTLVMKAGLVPSRVELELPISHLQALLYYIASRVNNPIGITNEFHAGNSYAAKYEKACELLENVNIRTDQGSQNTRAQRNGWV